MLKRIRNLLDIRNLDFDLKERNENPLAGDA